MNKKATFVEKLEALASDEEYRVRLREETKALLKGEKPPTYQRDQLLIVRRDGTTEVHYIR